MSDAKIVCLKVNNMIKNLTRNLTLLALLAAFLALAITFQAHAQVGLSLTKLSIDFWPEYDSPEMLVMYNFSLAGANLPAEIKLRIPKDAEINAVAVCQPSGDCFNTEYTQSNQGPWKVVALQATLSDVRVEYYDPGLTKSGAKRTYIFDWPGDYAVQALKVVVQQPTEAKNFRLTPGSFVPGSNGNGLNDYVMDYGPVQQGETFSINLSYTKDTDALTVENSRVEAAQPLNSAQTGRASLPAALPIMLGILGMAFILGGGYWYWRTGKGVPKISRPVRHRKTSGAAASAAAGPVYCHQCGKRAGENDVYCRTCGVALRR